MGDDEVEGRAWISGPAFSFSKTDTIASSLRDDIARDRKDLLYLKNSFRIIS